MTKESILPNSNYKLTVGNLSCVVAIIMAVINFNNPGQEGWGIYIAFLLIAFGLLMFAFDFIVQKFRLNYFIINIVEVLIIIGGIILWKT